MGKSIKAILLMGGRGERFSTESPKQFHSLAGKKIYLHTLEQLLKTALFQEIILPCHSDWIPTVKQETKGMPVIVIEGGETRQDSSYRGLLACGEQTDYVIIHDAVRPFISTSILQQNVERAIRFGAVDTCISSADTIVHSKTGNAIDSIPNRSEYLRGQTPQSFAYTLILEAHQKARADGIANATDDCALILRLGKAVHIVKGSEENIKITTPMDFLLAEQLLQQRSSSSRK